MLANAVGQLKLWLWIDRIREQARSHSGWVVCQWIGCLRGRHREQARSHSKQEQDQEIAAFGGSYIGIAVGFG